MAEEGKRNTGPDLTLGVGIGDFKNGVLRGHVGEEEVLLVSTDSEVFAIDAYCSHYHGPLADGLVTGSMIRCPWHHACFDLSSGAAACPPALSPLRVWQVEREGEQIVVRRKLPVQGAARRAAAAPGQIVIVGGGGAGFAAAEMLRREGFEGGITMLGAEAAAPVDRPNLSKDYLAGSAPEEWLPLRPESFYAEARIDLRLGAEVAAVDGEARRVTLADGQIFSYDKLLLATGAEPVRLSIPGAERAEVHTLRSLADCRAIIAATAGAGRALVVGASFIGLEVAAALRARDIEVHVIAPDKRPMERSLGPAMGDFIRALHEEHGVIFHLGEALKEIGAGRATLQSGKTLAADFIVAGIGVRPRLGLAERLGLSLDRGVVVNAYLETSLPGIYAAGDIARWPDRYSGESIRVEHWVVAERQGQTAARNMLGQREVFDAVPFFWSQHYDVPINYVGHAESWDEILVDGDITARNCILRYKSNGRVRAVASIYRDLDSLKAEFAMEQDVPA